MKEKMKITSITLAQSLWERVATLAAQNNIRFSQLVTRALKSYVNGEHIDGFDILSDGSIEPKEARQKLSILKQL